MLESLIKMMNDARKSCSANLTIGRALEDLKKLPKKAKIVLDQGAFSLADYSDEDVNKIFYLSGSFGGYRDYYEDLYVGVSYEHSEFTVEDFIGILKDALKQGEMCGYDGGEYSITKDTILWLDMYRDCRGIAPIMFYRFSEQEVLLITKYIPL